MNECIQEPGFILELLFLLWIEDKVLSFEKFPFPIFIFIIFYVEEVCSMMRWIEKILRTLFKRGLQHRMWFRRRITSEKYCRNHHHHIHIGIMFYMSFICHSWVGILYDGKMTFYLGDVKLQDKNLHLNRIPK